jgi:peptidoglycan/xylan/chitin deacetylase (PgdA/CDA1 family)
MLRKETIGMMDILFKERNGVKVLLYHNMDSVKADKMTVSLDMMNAHFQYLNEKGYTIVSISTFVKAINKNKELPPKTLVITFDDGYKNHIEFIEPLLKKHGFCACVFLKAKNVLNYYNSVKVGPGFSGEETNICADPLFFEFGIQVDDQIFQENRSVAELKNELLLAQEFFTNREVNVIPVIAYPYGKMMYSKRISDSLKIIFSELGICAAFRLGNKAIQFPVADKFELPRILITDGEDLKSFKKKLKKGSITRYKVF